MGPGVVRGWALVLLAGVAGCSGNGGADPDASLADALHVDAGPSPDGKVVLGGVRVLETWLDSSGSEAGSVIWIEGPHVHPWPGSLFGVLNSGYLGTDWEVVASEGDCVYIEATEPFFCEPACDWDEYCTSDGSCAKYPEVLDVGTMTLAGLAIPITLERNTSGRYVSSEQFPPADLFDANDQITLSAPGSVGPEFSVSVTAVASLSPALACDVDLSAGGDLEIQWTQGAGDATVRFEVISWFVHAYSFPKILCEVSDTGSLTVPAALFALWAPDRFGLALTRLRRATAALGENQEIVLEVASVRSCSPPPL
jgi:hypothetical protein